MKTFSVAFIGVLLLIFSVRTLALPQSPTTGTKSPKQSSVKKTSAKEGEQRFQANCGRCHTPPESLSPREVKAVLQHMRVRAMLSEQDEQLILKYLAP
jgi:hypothetical protein